MKLNFKSLKAKTWLYFMTFTAIILIILWLLQIIFIKTFYQEMKIKEIVKIGEKIETDYNNGKIDEDINHMAFKNNLFITIYDEESNTLKSSDIFGRGADRNQRFMPPPEDFINMKQRLAISGESSIYYISGGHNMERLFYGSFFESKEGAKLYVFITASLPPIDATTEIMKDLFIVVTVILFLLAFFVAFIFSKHISKPVIKLTDTAEKLAGGNFNVTFEKGNYSEIDQLAETLNYATKEMSRVDTLRKDLIANISHDLRTPLTIIKMYGEMIRDVSGDNISKRDEHANLIIKESDVLTGLVNEILELSKVQSENFVFEHNEFNLSKMLGEIVSRFNVLAEKDGYDFHLYIEKDLYVKAGEKLIERVLYNLISNAINYTGDDKKIVICLKSIENKICFQVSDTGDGIPESQLDNIWDRYYKLNEIHERSVVGTGLGLSIVKDILKQHNAEFGVKSILGEGSAFWFKLNKI